MKGQTFVDFYVSMTLFVLFAAYIFFQMTTLLPSHVNAIDSQILHSEAYQMSELLVTYTGSPANWENVQTSQIKTLGLVDESQNETNLLSNAKITELNSTCNSQGGYATLQNLLATNYSFSISIINKVTDQTLMSCYPQSAPAPTNLINITRIVAFSSGGYGTLVMQVWQ